LLTSSPRITRIHAGHDLDKTNPQLSVRPVLLRLIKSRDYF
jgi:hypothetical protein